MDGVDRDPWSPLSPDAVQHIFSAAPFRWWIAGGYCVDHFVGRVIRPYGDIDILILRRDHLAARRYLRDWDCWAADPPGTLRPWPAGEALNDHIHDIWCRRPDTRTWSFQIMLDEADGEHWYSRLCPQVTWPIAELSQADGPGPPYLRIEQQLFYKAAKPRPKDELDFDAAIPFLDGAQRDWLAHAIEIAHGDGNPWLARLR